VFRTCLISGHALVSAGSCRVETAPTDSGSAGPAVVSHRETIDDAVKIRGTIAAIRLQNVHTRECGSEAEHRRALALLEKAHGPDHPHVAQSRNNLALVMNFLMTPVSAYQAHSAVGAFSLTLAFARWMAGWIGRIVSCSR
jgi:hypothetical protein